MKNAFKSLILAALAVQSLVSCQENAPKTVSSDTTSSSAPVVESTTPAPAQPTMEMPGATPSAPASSAPTGTTGSTTVPVVNKTTPAPMPTHPTAPATTTTKGGTAAPASGVTPAPAPAPVTPNATDAAATKVPPTAPAGKTTSIRWETPNRTHDWGAASIGDKITHIYKFTNTGTEPLVILDAKASCGCTVPEKPQAPIAPGKSSEIKVVFDSANKPAGATAKTVTVTANTEPGTMVLTLKGELKVGEDKK
jgi:Protein of unknown function (DUF1573)